MLFVRNNRGKSTVVVIVVVTFIVRNNSWYTCYQYHKALIFTGTPYLVWIKQTETIERRTLTAKSAFEKVLRRKVFKDKWLTPETKIGIHSGIGQWNPESTA